MILIKLGGSVITDKSSPLTAREDAVRGIAKALAKIKEPLIAVHGGGSFGHYWSVQYGMHTKPARYDLHGASVVKNSMISLHLIIINAMEKVGLNPYTVQPESFISRNRVLRSKASEMRDMAEHGLVPVTFGDALWAGGGRTGILSGDSIMSRLAKALRPRLCIFALDVDGLYEDMESRTLIGIAGERDSAIDQVKADVTGGMSRKVKEAKAISKMGLDVFFANGAKPERIVSAVRGKRFEGTLFQGA